MTYRGKPIFIRLDVTSKCNFNCKGCYRPRKILEKDLCKDKVLKLIDKIKKFGIENIILGGGEPFLRNDLAEIITYANKKGINCDIVSNGTLIKEKHIDLLKKHVANLNISLDGHNEKINSRIRPKLTFNKAMKTLHLLKRNHVKFNLITTLSKKNINYLEEIILLGKKIGAEEHHFIRFVPIGRGSRYKSCYLTDKKWLKVIEKLKSSNRLLFDEKYLTGDCGVGTELLCILSNGDITVCTRKSQRRFRLGNILKDDVGEIWNNSSLLKKIRKTKRTNCVACNF